jgi:RimJ/RimL family protein N-acetyltransferase
LQIFAETERLILREILPEDAKGIFELDSDKEVHKFLGNNPINTLEKAQEIIQFIRQQYIDNGIGRWAVIEKKTGNFLGWAGLKLIREPINNHYNYYDLGYRFIRQYWGQGFASETAKASLEYGFGRLKLNEIFAIANCENLNSKRVLEKVGFKFTEVFDHEGVKHDWYRLAAYDWVKVR